MKLYVDNYYQCIAVCDADDHNNNTGYDITRFNLDFSFKKKKTKNQTSFPVAKRQWK